MSGQDDVADVVPPAGPPGVPFWADQRLRGYVVQLVFLVLVVGFFVWLGFNAAEKLSQSGKPFGFGFLNETAGFDIGFKLIDHQRSDTLLHVFWVGLLNTLLVSILGIVLATLLGFVIGIARLSPNWIVARMASVYVEFVRNVPLLLWILFFYLALIPALPLARNAFSAGDWAFLANSGLYIPKLHWTEGAWPVLVAVVIAIAGWIALHRYAIKRQLRTGKRIPDGLIGFALLIGLPALALVLTNFPVSLEFPERVGRGCGAERGICNLRGGLSLQSELIALLSALTIYTAAYIAEIVRSGIEGVSKGQSEAASALGLHRGQRLRLVVIPQAMRIIIPPLASQYLNLAKNSSLATAIAYPDLVAVFAGTALNQKGHEIEILAMTAAVYLTISLVTSLLMNIYNARIQLKER